MARTAAGARNDMGMDDFINTQITLDVIPKDTNWRKYTNLVPLWRAQKALGLPLRPAVSDIQK